MNNIFFNQDWPDCMAMDEKMFANYAEQLEKEDFEDEVCGTHIDHNDGQFFRAMEWLMFFY